MGCIDDEFLCLSLVTSPSVVYTLFNTHIYACTVICICIYMHVSTCACVCMLDINHGYMVYSTYILPENCVQKKFAVHMPQAKGEGYMHCKLPMTEV